MATSRAARPKRKAGASPSATDVERTLLELRERLRAEGALKLTSLAPKSLRGSLVSQLASEGYELTRTWLRRPLHAQIREALAHGALVTRKDLSSLVRGASTAEVARALTELSRAGEVFLVLRGKHETFTGASTELLAGESLRSLSDAMARLSKVLSAANKKRGAALLRSDVQELLAQANAWLPARTADAPRESLERDRANAGHAAERGRSETGQRASLLDALDATRDERTGLSFVPRLMGHLLPDVPLAMAHEVLLEAARDEVIELRPEGGLGRLSTQELELCPPGPGGTRLSWARRVDAP